MWQATYHIYLSLGLIRLGTPDQRPLLLHSGGKNSPTRGFLHNRWGVMFLVAVGFWNFLGAGVFGF